MEIKYKKAGGKCKYELLENSETLVFWSGLAGVHTSHRYFELVDGKLRVKAGYCWDGASGPAIDTKTVLRGSLYHDALYQLIREGHIDKKHKYAADRLLRRTCLEDGMTPFRAWYVYHAVRLFGERSL